MNHYVYVYTDPSRNEPIYVGMGQKKRAWHHLKRKDMHPFIQRLQKMGRDGVVPAITFLAQGVDEELADLIEVEAIAKFGRKDLGLGPLLNLTDGGDGLKNASIETRLKIGESSRGRKHTPETKAAISAFLRTRKRNPLSEEAKDKIRQKALGRKASIQHRAKITAAGSQPCTVNGVDIYPSRKALIAALGQGVAGKRSPNFRYV